jgi:hypothetical protein
MKTINTASGLLITVAVDEDAKTHARNNLSFLSLIYHIEKLWLLPHPLYVHTCKDILY